MASYKMGSSPTEEQDVQLVEVPKQVAHVELQLQQPFSAKPSSSSVVARNMLEGHVDVHVFTVASKLAPGTHEVQAVEPTPLQVAHDASHAVHVLLASANLPFGHAPTHEPSS